MPPRGQHPGRQTATDGRVPESKSAREAGATAVRLETDHSSPWYALAHGAFGMALY